MQFRFSNGGWNWTYVLCNDGKEYLSLCVTDENLRLYKCLTHYTTEDLRFKPQSGDELKVSDAMLLNDFQTGLHNINIIDEGTCLELSINAIACLMFVHDVRFRHFDSFVRYQNQEFFRRGDVVTLTTKEGACGDFFVLDDLPEGTCKSRLS